MNPNWTRHLRPLLRCGNSPAQKRSPIAAAASGSAYLFDAAGVPAKCPWDLNDDDLVGTTDLLLLLGSWGDPYGTADPIELLGNWEPCP